MRWNGRTGRNVTLNSGCGACSGSCPAFLGNQGLTRHYELAASVSLLARGLEHVASERHLLVDVRPRHPVAGRVDGTGHGGPLTCTFVDGGSLTFTNLVREPGTVMPLAAGLACLGMARRWYMCTSFIMRSLPQRSQVTRRNYDGRARNGLSWVSLAEGSDRALAATSGRQCEQVVVVHQEPDCENHQHKQ